MSKITLDVDKNDVNTVLTILNNLRAGLVKNITVDNKKAPSSLVAKKAAKQAVLEDEFMANDDNVLSSISRTCRLIYRLAKPALHWLANEKSQVV